jgi:hypothetical protein
MTRDYPNTKKAERRIVWAGLLMIIVAVGLIVFQLVTKEFGTFGLEFAFIPFSMGLVFTLASVTSSTQSAKNKALYDHLLGPALFGFVMAFAVLIFVVSSSEDVAQAGDQILDTPTVPSHTVPSSEDQSVPPDLFWIEVILLFAALYWGYVKGVLAARKLDDDPPT